MVSLDWLLARIWSGLDAAMVKHSAADLDRDRVGGSGRNFRSRRNTAKKGGPNGHIAIQAGLKSEGTNLSMIRLSSKSWVGYNHARLAASLAGLCACAGKSLANCSGKPLQAAPPTARASSCQWRSL